MGQLIKCRGVNRRLGLRHIHQHRPQQARVVRLPRQRQQQRRLIHVLAMLDRIVHPIQVDYPIAALQRALSPLLAFVFQVVRDVRDRGGARFDAQQRLRDSSDLALTDAAKNISPISCVTSACCRW